MADENGKYADLKDIDVTHLKESKVLVPVEDFEPGTLDITKCLLMDSIISLATGYYAIPENEMNELKKIIKDEPPLYRTAYPFDNKVSLEMSGFVNSFLIRYPDWGDTMRLPAAKTGSGGHPNDAMAAILTFLDVPGISGKKIMELIRLSYELWVIFHSRMLVKSNGFDASSVMALTVPVLASVAFDASPERTQNAMNFGATMLGLLGNTRYGGGGGVKNMKNAACGCQIFKGLWSYRMSSLVNVTSAAFTAPMGWYEDIAPFDGELTGISDMEVYGPLELKVWPMYNVAQAPVDAAVALYDDVHDKLDHIESIKIYKTPKDIIKVSQKMENRYPYNHATADHSPYWGVAMGLKYGGVALHHFCDEYYNDPDIKRMLGISECVIFDEDELAELGGAVSASGVEVIMDDGTVYKHMCRQHGGAFDGLSLTERAQEMRRIVDIKQGLIEESYGYDLSGVAEIVYDMENRTGDELLNALHAALKVNG